MHRIQMTTCRTAGGADQDAGVKGFGQEGGLPHHTKTKRGLPGLACCSCSLIVCVGAGLQASIRNHQERLPGLLPKIIVAVMEETGEENQLSSLKGLPQAKRRDSSDQAQNDNSATSLLTDVPSRTLAPNDSSYLPGELELFPWTIFCPDLLESEIEDCISEALPYAKKRTAPSVPQHSQKSAKYLLENQAFVKSSFRRQILADRVQISIENLQIFYENLSNMVGLEVHGNGESEGLPKTKKQREISQIPNDYDAKFGHSVPNLQVCNRDRQFGLGKSDVVSSENHTSAVGVIAPGTSSDERPWQWMSQITQECLTETLSAESPLSRTEGGESKYTEGKISASTDDLKDLLSSLQSLLSVLKDHEKAEQISRARLQALRERKEALRLEKQQHKDKDKQLRAAQCVSSVSQESIREWMAERD